MASTPRRSRRRGGSRKSPSRTSGPSPFASSRTQAALQASASTSGGDELTGNDVLAILSRVTGRPFTYFQVPLDVIRQRMGQDGAKMCEWFDRVGFTFDRAALRREFPDVTFQHFELWAKAQDWNALLQGA